MFSTCMALLSLPFLKFLILYGWMLAFMYVCVPHVCLVALEFRREHSVVGIVIWVLATERQPSPRTSDLSHWVIFPAHNCLKLSSPSPPFPLYLMISWWKEPLVLWPQSRTVVGPKPFLSFLSHSWVFLLRVRTPWWETALPAPTEVGQSRCPQEGRILGLGCLWSVLPRERE